MNTKIYIAAPVPHLDTAKSLTKTLKDRGYDIVSSWISDPLTGYDRNGLSKEDNDKRLRQCASRDLAEIESADHFILLNYEGSGGGMHAELGFALGNRMTTTVWAIGRPTHVLTHHLSILWCFDISNLLGQFPPVLLLKQLSQRRGSEL